MKYILIAGSRPELFPDSDAMRPDSHTLRNAVFEHVRRLAEAAEHSFPNPALCIVQGGARGVDTWASQAASLYDLKTMTFTADWKQYGRKAGPIRNAEMIEFITEEDGEAYVFWDGHSRGTADTIKRLGLSECPFAVFVPDPLLPGRVRLQAFRSEWGGDVRELAAVEAEEPEYAGDTSDPGSEED